MRRLLALLLLIILQAGSAGAAHSSGIHKIKGFLPDLHFALSSASSPEVTEADFKGKVVILFFGYASCPDICPMTMAQLSHVMQNLGDDAKNVRIVFISVDPHRDTPAILQEYVNAFDSNTVGLTGSERQITAVARRYRISYQIARPVSADSESYEVTHSRGIYFFDQAGKARFLASDGESIEALPHATQELLAEQTP